MKRPAFLILAAMFLLAQAGMTFGTAEQPPDRLPYSGVIQNHSKYDISFPSANSSGTLIVPAGGYLEYRVYTPSFNLIGYVDGKPYYCQKIDVRPRGYAFMCKHYDFMAEVMAKEEPMKKPAPLRQKRPVRKLKPGEVEGLG